MSRAINGSAPFLPTLVARVMLVGLHWFGFLVKGEPVLLIKDGRLNEKGLRRSSISHRDLEEALRIESHVTEPDKVQLAYLERNGGISVIPRKPEPRVLDLSVQDGVQTVRLVV